MECLEISLHHKLCTDSTSTLVYKNFRTTIISNSLALCFLLKLCQCRFFRGPQVVLSWQWSTCEAISVIIIYCFCKLFGLDSRMIIKPIQQNSVNLTHTWPYMPDYQICHTIRQYLFWHKFLRIMFCYCAYTRAEQPIRRVNSNLYILLWCYLSNTACLLCPGLLFTYTCFSHRHHYQASPSK